MEIIKTDFPEKCYWSIPHPKRQIVLHHTVSSTAYSPIETFKQSAKRIAVAYIIDPHGLIYELFNPNFWACHIGSGSTPKHNQASIGIELVNEGALKLKDGKYYWEFGVYKGEVYESDAHWREYKYFAKYPEEQILACAWLVKKLCKDFNIPAEVLTNYCYKREYLDDYYGVLSHHNLRSDKSDVSLAFDLKRFQTLIK
jgi:N-acetyl-anhydromuramyl-L-alanine amidase AmpD